MALGGIGPFAVKQAADAEFLRNLQSGRTPPIVGASGGVVRVPGPMSNLGPGLASLGQSIGKIGEMQEKKAANEALKVGMARMKEAYQSGDAGAIRAVAMEMSGMPGGERMASWGMTFAEKIQQEAGEKANERAERQAISAWANTQPEEQRVYILDLANSAKTRAALLAKIPDQFFPNSQKPEIFGGAEVGYFALGRDGNLKPLVAGQGQKPTSLQQNLEAAGYKPGTAEFRDAIIKALTKPMIGMGDNYGTIPAGYGLVKHPDGSVSMKPVPGGPAARKEDEAKAARGAAETRNAAQAGLVVDDIGRAIKAVENSPNMVTGIGGAIFSALPGSPAYDLSEMLNGLKGNLAFDKLTALKKEAGGVGAISDTEMGLLQNAYGALGQSQSAEQLTYNLKRLHNLYNDTVYGEGKGPKRYDLQPDKTGGGAKDTAERKPTLRLNEDGTVTDIATGQRVLKRGDKWVPAD
jgi:hypothetical protein